MKPEAVVEDICCSDRRRVKRALQGAASQKDLLADAVVAELAAVVANPEAWSQNDERTPLYLYYLAAAWREKRAHKPMVAFMRSDPRQVESAFDDLTDDDIPTILSDTYDGDPASLLGLMRDGDAWTKGRCSAIIALSFLTLDERYPRQDFLREIMDFGKTLDPESLPDYDLGNQIGETLRLIRAWETDDFLITLADRDVMDEMHIEDLEDDFASAKKHAPLSSGPTPTIENAWESVCDFEFFSNPAESAEETIKKMERWLKS